MNTSQHDFDASFRKDHSRTQRRSLTADVVIPAHLLQAAGAIRSARDFGETPNWEPQRQLTVRDNPTWRLFSNRANRSRSRPAIHRALTVPIQTSTPTTSRPPSRAAAARVASRGEQSACTSDNEDKFLNPNRQSLPTSNLPRRSWRLSYTPGVSERLTLSPKPSIQELCKHAPQHGTHASQPGALSNPFDDPSGGVSRSSSSRSTTNPFSTKRNSFSSDHTNRTEDEQSDTGMNEPRRIYVPQGGRPRRGTLEAIADAIVPNALQRKLTNASYTSLSRTSTIRDTFEKAKRRGQKLQRNKWVQIGFEYGLYTFSLLFIYFVLVGIPLWNGAVWWLYWVVANKFVFAGGFSIVLGIALFYAFAPLLIFFENDPPPEEVTTETKVQPNVHDTALLIPCYKSANLIAATLEAALKIFPPSHIFVIANGNSPEPLDNTEEVCRPYGVNHIWSPIGCKLVAQFVGCHAAKAFKNVLLIDDDCALPENFPVVTDRLKGNVKCIGYTIKSVGPNSSKGNYCQQAQDLEYKLSGLQREFAGRIGSATFPHGAIALWDNKLLLKTFNEHPGFNVSEDWFFGHVARELGSRITMCSSVFVETETPTAVFFSSGGSRGGFGEMTIFKQRFKRWNFFFVNGMWYNMKYIFCSWKLGWWEIGAKIFVFQEVYETLLYLLTPFILPISFYVRPSFCGILLASTVIMYFLNVIIFNEVHLRRKNERIGWVVLYLYYLPYKIVLTFINVASCYWSLYKYARYFAKRHPKVTEDERAVGVVVRLEESAAAAQGGIGRRLTVRTMRANSTKSDDSSVPSNVQSETPEDASLDDPKLMPEPSKSGMSTPTRLNEGVGAVDFAVPRYDERREHIG